MNIEHTTTRRYSSEDTAAPIPLILLVEDDELHRHLKGRAFSNHDNVMHVNLAGYLSEALRHVAGLIRTC